MQGIESPFQFLTASYLIRVQNLRATTLAEFAREVMLPLLAEPVTHG